MDSVGRGGRIQEHANTGDVLHITESIMSFISFYSSKMEQLLASVTATTSGE